MSKTCSGASKTSLPSGLLPSTSSKRLYPENEAQTQQTGRLPMGNKQAKREFQIYEDEQKEQEDTEDGREAKEEATDDEWANVED